MSGNKSFARSMNGINNIEINEVQFPDGSTITSASNLVQLDTTNDFTSNNSFNSNLPTSTKTPEVGDLTDVMILNKHSADLLYSGTDENDFTTAFERDGTTGIITLTTANTGTPLSGNTSFTSITDAQILAIGTNTTAITNNATAIGTNATAITTNTTAITNNTTAITNNTTAITNNATAIGNAVLKTTAQTIQGINTFDEFPVKSGTGTALDPTADNQFATKQYVDDNTGGGGNFVTTNTIQTITCFKSFSSGSGVQFASIGMGSGATGGGSINMPFSGAIFSQNQGTAKITTQGKIGIRDNLAIISAPYKGG